MLTTLITETGTGRGFPVQGIITLLVAVLIFYPIQKKVRAAASRRRRERWAQAGLLTEAERRVGHEGGPGEPGPEESGPDVPGEPGPGELGPVEPAPTTDTTHPQPPRGDAPPP